MKFQNSVKIFCALHPSHHTILKKKNPPIFHHHYSHSNTEALSPLAHHHSYNFHSSTHQIIPHIHTHFHAQKKITWEMTFVHKVNLFSGAITRSTNKLNNWQSSLSNSPDDGQPPPKLYALLAKVSFGAFKVTLPAVEADDREKESCNVCISLEVEGRAVDSHPT